MISELTKKYLDELQKSQKKIDDLKVKSNSLDETSEDQFEVLTSEYNLEIGPLKLKVKKSKTFSGTRSLNKSASQAINKQRLDEESGHMSEAKEEILRSLELPQDNSKNESSLLPSRPIDITI